MKKKLVRFFLLLGEVFMVLFIGFVLGIRYSNYEIIKAKNLSDKHLELFKIAVKWIKEPEHMEKFIEKNQGKSIGIYGMSYLGDCLQKTFRKGGMTKIYGIDRNASRLYNPDIEIYSMENELPDADIIIITAFIYFESIKRDLEMKIGKNTNIISLENIFFY